MKWAQKGCILILAVTIVTVVLRLPRLAQRPMHGDEAVHAYKFGELLEQNSYSYDPGEYHGPTLAYFTLIPAWLSGIGNYKDLTEFTLRIVPVFFAVLLVVMSLLLVDGLGRPAVIITAVLTAVSPAFVFYSRYYIHEILLVCFTFGVITSGYRYTKSNNIWWALSAGMFLGLMYATKETCIIAFGSMLLALVLVVILQTKQQGIANIKAHIKPGHLVAALASAVIVSALFYSSFFTNPGGIPNSIRAYAGYFHRAGQNQLHIHPWYYYLKMLCYSQYFDGPIWSEAIIVVLAASGFVLAMTKKGIAGVNFHLLRFIAFYTAIMTVIYSVIPYKTPWSMLGFLHGMILLASVAVFAMIKSASNVRVRVLICLLLAAGAIHLTWQAYSGSYRFYADSRNPYVYAHPTTDVFTVAQRVEEISLAHPHGRNMYIQVICPGDDHWPLPWYLRCFGNNVDWWDEVEEDTPAAPVIIASASVEPALMIKLYQLPPPGQRNLYMPLFDTYIWLRPDVELRGYVTKDLWDSYRQHRIPTGNEK
ncbi:MAG: flippase activity-associated protein Agl23 [Planctomycetota bacterium]|jgi:uncharacterized protein (TIGR03663 family)